MNDSILINNPNAARASKWFPYGSPAPGDRLRLFCIPHAGGGASAYRAWALAPPPGVAVYPIQLPGRESRFQETLFLDLRALLGELTADLGEFLDVPFAFFGHSMGAIITYEWARSTAGSEMRHLFVSGRRAPHLPNRGRPLYDLSDESLIEELRRMEGVPENILNNDEWRRTSLPILRADFTMMDTYSWAPAAPLSIPISAVGGTQDPNVAIDEIHGWSRHTPRFRMHLLPGGHFFLRDASAAVLDLVSRELMGRD